MVKFKQGINPELRRYIESQIISKYKNFDPAHQESHVRDVIENALELSRHYNVNTDMIYTAAAYHDLGLMGPRETHHLLSGKIIREDRNLKKWFTEEQIEIIARAAEDHRASKGEVPRDLEGRIISEADRIIDPIKTIERSKNYDKSRSREEVYNYLKAKYGKGGYVKVIIPESNNAKKLKEFQEILADKKKFDKIYDQV